MTRQDRKSLLRASKTRKQAKNRKKRPQNDGFRARRGRNYEMREKHENSNDFATEAAERGREVGKRVFSAKFRIIEKVQGPKSRPGPFFSPRTRRAPRSACDAQSLLANLALFARGILRLECPVQLGQCPGLLAEFPSRSLAIPDRYFPDEPNLGVPGAD